MLPMSNSIYLKLEQFIKKYYTNALIRGMIYFVGLGLCYLILTVLLEHFLWFGPVVRAVLFYLFVAVEVFLLINFILIPLFYLLKLKKGINYEFAAFIIGGHFPEVSDSLINYLQLAQASHKSELLEASIDQKAQRLQPVPFAKAVDFGKNKRLLPIAVLPIIIFILFYLSGNGNVVNTSFNRLTHYNKQFQRPAPFVFVVQNKMLQTNQNQDFIIKVLVVGAVVPNDAMIVINSNRYYMIKKSLREFEFKIDSPAQNVSFSFEAGEVLSSEYELKILKVPSIANFEMLLQFPSYLGRKPEIVNGTGNAIVPEGTLVKWKLSAQATESVQWQSEVKSVSFARNLNQFTLQQTVVDNVNYQIVSSNSVLKNYEKLNYQISIIKDQFPSINVSVAPDSLKVENTIVLGQVADDYGLSKLQVVYYQHDKPKSTQKGIIFVKNDVYDQFVFSFPANLPVQPGVVYDYFFEVFDNDQLHNFKSVRSSVFSNRIATLDEQQDSRFEQQNENINSLEKSLKSQTKQLSELDKLQKSNKEKESLEFKDQQKINDFLKKQQLQDDMLKQLSDKVKQNLEQFKDDKKDALKEALQKKADNLDKDFEKNKKLLDELKQLNDKIKLEELTEKLDQLKQNAKKQTKSLEQLVELTKKYYVQKKAEQLKEKLGALAQKQEDLANKEKENTADKQNEINKDFDKLQDDLKKLEQENKELKRPLDIPKDAAQEKSIDEDLNKALSDLQNDSKKSAASKQKSAANKMKQMAQKMQQRSDADAEDQLEEDVEMLRQVLDNLVALSLTQEQLMKQFANIKRGSPSFSKHLKTQQNLKQEFSHIDDSLFALSLRNEKFGDIILKQVEQVHYNVDKSLENLADANLNKGIFHQQYTTTAANKLGDFLTDLLSNMQQSLLSMSMGKPKKGKGSGEMQLPDIIKKQGELGEKGKKAKGSKPGEGDKPGSSDGGFGKDGKGGKGDQGKGASGQGNGSGNKAGGDGQSNGDGEVSAKEIMEIYKEQQELREQLQQELNKRGMGGIGQNAINQMKDIEKQLLNKGFKNDVLQKILNVKQELLKLDSAIQEQGQDEKRQAEVRKKDFNNTAPPLPKVLQDYLKSVEILNRQRLPLQSIYNQKVQRYFNTKP